MPVCDLLYLYVGDRSKDKVASITQSDLEVINTQSPWSRKGGMQDAIKMMKNSRKQRSAGSWGAELMGEGACLSLALQRLRVRARDGAHLLPGSPGDGRKAITKVILKVWVFLCLPPRKEETPAVPDNEVNEKKEIVIGFKVRLCLALLVIDRGKQWPRGGAQCDP